jgi:hypothetical protein
VKRHKHPLLAYFATILLITVSLGCNQEPKDDWVTSPGVSVTPTMIEDNGKKYLQVIYENFGEDTLTKMRYELVGIKGGKADTTIKDITLPKLMRPKDRHVVPHPIGAQPVDYDEVRAGKVWVVKSN